MEEGKAVSKGKHLLLERILVFRGPFALKAATEVCAVPPLTQRDVKIHLAELCEAGLVKHQKPRTGPARFKIWLDDEEVVRAKVFEQASMAEIRQRHYLWCKRFIEELRKTLKNDEQDRALEVMQAEHENLRAALTWSLRPDADPGDALSLIIHTFRFWHIRNHVEEGLEWLLQVLDKAADLQDERVLRAMNTTGLMFDAIGKYKKGEQMHRKTLTLAKNLNDFRAQAITRGNWAHNHMAQGKYELGMREFERAIEDLHKTNDTSVLSSCLCNYGMWLIKLKEFDKARGLLEQARSMDLQNGDLWGLNTLNVNIAEVYAQEGECDKAEELYLESLQNLAAFHDLGTASGIFTGLAKLAVKRNQYQQAAVFFGVADFAGEMASAEMYEADVTTGCAAVLEARAVLGDEEFDELWTQGNGFTFDAAVEYAVCGRIYAP